MDKPVVNQKFCTKCGTCTEMSPDTFQMDKRGAIEVADLDAFPAEEIKQAMKWCPEQCISWKPN